MAASGTRTKERLLQVALQLFATRGYADTSIQAIADAVGVSQTAVLHHFKTKLELFHGVVGFIAARNDELRSATANPADDAAERLMKHFEANFAWGVETRHVAQIMTAIFHFATYDPEFQKLYAGILAGARHKILELLLAGVREGLFTLVLPPETTAEILHDSLLGMMLTTVTSKKPREAHIKLRAAWVSLLMRFAGYEPRAECESSSTGRDEEPAREQPPPMPAPEREPGSRPKRRRT